MRMNQADLPGRSPVRLRSASVAIAVLLTLAGCASDRDEEDAMQSKINELDTRVARIERVVSNQSLVELAQNLDAVQADVRKLRGRVDELENSQEALRKQQRDMYSDLDKRLGGGQGAAGAGAGAAGPNSGPGAGQGPVAGSSVEQAVYSQAFDALKAGSYSVAITGFKDFLSTYPQSPLSENAQYWLGEAYYVTRDYGGASEAFHTVLQKWPDSRKAPDALLKLGFTQFELKRYGESRKTLEQVAQKYPDSDAARLATERLKRMPANPPAASH